MLSVSVLISFFTNFSLLGVSVLLISYNRSRLSRCKYHFRIFRLDTLAPSMIYRFPNLFKSHLHKVYKNAVQ